MANTMVEVMKRILDWHRQVVWQGAVVTYAAGPPAIVTVMRNGQTVADGKTYRVAEHVVSPLIAGDRVLLLDTTGDGGSIVIAKMP